MLRRAPHGVLRAVDTELVAAYVVQAETLARAAKAAADMPPYRWGWKPDFTGLCKLGRPMKRVSAAIILAGE